MKKTLTLIAATGSILATTAVPAFATDTGRLSPAATSERALERPATNYKHMPFTNIQNNFDFPIEVRTEYQTFDVAPHTNSGDLSLSSKTYQLEVRVANATNKPPLARIGVEQQGDCGGKHAFRGEFARDITASGGSWTPISGSTVDNEQKKTDTLHNGATIGYSFYQKKTVMKSGWLHAFTFGGKIDLLPKADIEVINRTPETITLTNQQTSEKTILSPKPDYDSRATHTVNVTESKLPLLRIGTGDDSRSLLGYVSIYQPGLGTPARDAAWFGLTDRYSDFGWVKDVRNRFYGHLGTDTHGDYDYKIYRHADDNGNNQYTIIIES